MKAITFHFEVDRTFTKNVKDCVVTVNLFANNQKVWQRSTTEHVSSMLEDEWGEEMVVQVMSELLNRAKPGRKPKNV